MQASDSKWVYLYQKKTNKCTQFNISVFLIVQLDESPFVNGKITHKITIVPTANLTVSCTVSNEFGADSKVINVSSCKYKLVVSSSRLSPLPALFS